MKDDIRKATAVIIQRDGEFLVGFSMFLRWSTSPYDAWKTRNVIDALKVARIVKGDLMLFNPVVGSLKPWGEVTT